MILVTLSATIRKMLMAHPTRCGAGIALFGDYYDLRAMRETIHKLCEHPNVQHDQGNFALGLAYDLRKAYEMKRETKTFGSDKLDKVKYRGAKILWPYFLVQVALLREFASTQPTNAKDHACLYTLEHTIDSAIQDQTSSSARYCLEWVRHFPGFTQDYLTEFINEQTWHFVYKTKKGKSRFDSLPQILRTLHWFSLEYRSFEKRVRKEAKARNCDPQSLEIERDWPNFKW